jgi:Fur family ferric uptake transcriptional regulator
MSGGGHHHLICNRCHGVIEFDECTAAELTQRLSERYNFRILSHLFELHGLCERCLTS